MVRKINRKKKLKEYLLIISLKENKFKLIWLTIPPKIS